MRIMTTDEFIRAARRVFGNRYGYDFVDYVRSYFRVTIVCRVHGPFYQRPDRHLLGHGCRKCGDEYRRSIQAQTTEQFIVAAKQKLCDQHYDYSRTVYVNRTTRVVIGCPRHGWFTQSPQHHLRGSGCKLCAAERASEANVYDTPAFVERARARWGSRYLYSETRYTGSRDEVVIACRRHGRFVQVARKHLEGVQGCKKCSRAGRTATYNAKHEKIFLKQALAIKDNRTRFDYAYFVYKGSHVKGKIFCNVHKRYFRQTPACHLAGKGCPRCCAKGIYQLRYFDRNPGAKTVLGILYLVQFSYGRERFLKLGVSRRSLKERFACKSHSSPYQLREIRVVEGLMYEVWECEQTAMEQFNELRYEPKHGRVNGSSECFTMSALPALTRHMSRLAKRQRVA
jgi:hypothetical protein